MFFHLKHKALEVLILQFYALLLGYATYFPDSRIYIFGLLPLKAPGAVALFAGLSLFFHFSGMMGGIAHLAHLAGIVLGYFYFIARLGINPIRVFMDRH